MLPSAPLERAKIGLIAICIGAVLFAGIVSSVEVNRLALGRAFVVCALCYLCTKGHRWAGLLLGVFVVLGGIGLILGVVQIGLTSLWGFVYLLGAVLYLGGFWLFFKAGGTSLYSPAPSTGA